MFLKKYINNKYFYTGMVFVVWWIFFDQESLIVQYDLAKIKLGLESQKEYYEDEISKDQQSIETLQNDTLELEKYAREKYLMKKDNEDVYVIVRE
ncbi:MAG: septum formation initiator family protein [Lentimicrobiaceae bacterium]|jgi:cell division protein FtsB|nr:septum formation initiator family protein [Lentimicrobiaceae bacterium]MCP4910298.1 septum formation initiator family protein [Bacteroidota bacterium]MBT3454257.1 septum formation initiator family protein [Lentimicrobiaceae bacterium]MBT3818943.1 septum formation initiator family protein [Lentimicrobiaceae bacterium]MBT4060711.1 septum formation initiator family protein [Lentimicrobiaceae bacterium]